MIKKSAVRRFFIFHRHFINPLFLVPNQYHFSDSLPLFYRVIKEVPDFQ